MAIAATAAACAIFALGGEAAYGWKLTINIYGSGTVEETQNPDNIRQRCGSANATTGEDFLQVSCVSGDIYCGWCNYTIMASPAPGFSFSRYEWVRPTDISWSGTTSSWSWNAGAAGDYEVKAFFVDDDAPQTGVTGGPAEGSFTKATTAGFDLTTSQPFGAGSYVCTLNDTPLSVCPDPLSLTSLTDGHKVLKVQAKDPSNNVDATPAVRSWTVDTVAPLTTLSGGPVQGSTTQNRSPAFDIAVNETATLACKLNGVAIACSAGRLELTNLADGAYVLSVRATDRAGNVEAVPVGRSWNVAVFVDADGDGARTDTDCNDADPQVFPHAPELPGNGKDDDCEGGDAPVRDTDGDAVADHLDACPAVAGGAWDADHDGCPGPFSRIRVSLTASWSSVTRAGVKLTRVVVANAPSDARVTVLCPGARRCPFGQERVSRGRPIALKKFAGKRLAPGRRFAIRITRPGMIGDYLLQRVKRPERGASGLARFVKEPIKSTRRCVPEGATAPQRTCSAVGG